MRRLFLAILGFFLILSSSTLARSAPLAHIQGLIALEGKALGRSLAHQELIMEAWEEGSKARADLLDPEGVPTRSAIVRKDLGRIYLIEHKDRSYREIPYPFPPDLIDYGKIPVLSALIRLGVFKNASVKTQELKGTRLIANYRCSGTRIDVADRAGRIEAEIWASPQIDADKLFGLEPSGIVQLAPEPYRGLVRKVLEAYTEIEGFPVEADVQANAARIANGSFHWELIGYDRTKAPVGSYDTPKNYAFE